MTGPQQYADDLMPVPARAFEPAAYSSLETAYAINALIDLYLITGQDSYKVASIRAADWLIANQLSPNLWSRFYEPETSTPLFSTRTGQLIGNINDLPSDERNSYRWIGGRETFPDIGIALDRIALLKQDLELLRIFDLKFEQNALFAKIPSARMPLEPANASIYDHNPTYSTSVFSKYCAGLIAEINTR